MKLDTYNNKLTTELGKTTILSENDMNILDKNMNVIQHSLKYAQQFRTDTEARVSVLNDVKHPDSDSKYWQSIRELKVQSDQLFYLNFDYKEKLIDKEELEHKLKQNYDNLFDEKRDRIKVEKIKYELLQMELVAKDRVREVQMWSNIISELKPNMKYSKDDVNEHQLLSYGTRFINEYIAAIKMKANSSPSEARNLMGLLNSTLAKIKSDGKFDAFIQNTTPEIRQFLVDNKIIQIENKTN